MKNKLLSIILSLVFTVTMIPSVDVCANTYNLSNPRVTSSENIWDCIYFGSYPQREVVANKAQCGTYGNDWGKSSDYIVDSLLYRKLENDGIWDDDNVCQIGKSKYKRIKREDTIGEPVGWYSHSPYYHWSNAIIYHYFKYEPIKWRVLSIEDNKAFVLSDKGLDNQMYNETNSEVTWETCSLRNWLNNSFYNTFSAEDKNAIVLTANKNTTSFYNGDKGGNDTNDKVFLLSLDEVCSSDSAVSYGFSRGWVKDILKWGGYNRRYLKTTTYAKAMGNLMQYGYPADGTCNWWLRSIGYDKKTASIVQGDGIVIASGYGVLNSRVAVRPALHLDLSKKVWSYAGATNGYDEIDEEEKDSPEIQFGENDLYGENSINLILQGAIDKSYHKVNDDIGDILYSYDNQPRWKEIPMILKTSPDPYKTLINRFSTDRYYKQDEIEENMVVELINAASEKDNNVKKYIDKAKDAFKMTKGTYKTITERFDTAENRSRLVQMLANGNAFTKDSAWKLINNIEEKKTTIDSIFDTTGHVVGIGSVVIDTAIIIEANHEMITTLKKYSNKNTELYKALDRVEKIQKNSGEKKMIDGLIEYGFYDILAKEGTNLVTGGAYSTAKFLYWFMGKILFSGNTGYDDIVKLVTTYTNMGSMYNMVGDHAILMADNYKTLDMEEEKSNHRFIYDTFTSSVDKAVEYALKIAKNTKDKEKLEKDYETFCQYYSYDAYISACIDSLIAEYLYIPSLNKITKYKSSSKSFSLKGTKNTAKENKALIKEINDGFNKAKVLNIPENIDGTNIEVIGEDAFKNNTDLEVVYLPNTVKSIEKGAFSGCNKLKAVFVDDGLVEIGEKAFSNCDNLKLVKLSQTVNTIAEDAFDANSEVVISSPTNSKAEAFAIEHDIETEIRDFEVKEIVIDKLPEKNTFGMSEHLDWEGIKVTAILEDDTTADASEDIYCEYADKKLGTSNVIVYYGGKTAEYQVQVTADNCYYTVSYENEYGKKIADDISGNALAGTNITLPAPQVAYYEVISETRDVQIGANNDFIVRYRSTAQNINNATIETSNSEKYTGNEITPQVTVIMNGSSLSEREDYTLKYLDNISTGKATIFIFGENGYCGVAEKTFFIESSGSTGDSGNGGGGGESQDETFTVTYNLLGHGASIPQVTVDKDSLLTAPTNPTAKGYVFAGWYKDSQFKNAWLFSTDKVTANITLYAKWISTDVIETSIKSLKPGKKSFTVKVKTVPAAQSNGYQLRYSLYKNMKKPVVSTISKQYNKVSKTIKKLKKKKTYYIQVRTIKNILGKSYYSDWSRVKKVKTK